MKFEDMSVRATKALLRAGVSSIEQAAKMCDHDWKSIPYCGITTLREIHQKLREHGYEQGFRGSSWSLKNGEEEKRELFEFLLSKAISSPVCSEICLQSFGSLSPSGIAAIAEEITDATISVIHRRREGFRKENPDDSV